MSSHKSITLIAGLALLCHISMSQQDIKFGLFEVRPVIYSSGPSKVYQPIFKYFLEANKTYAIQCSVPLRIGNIRKLKINGKGPLVYKTVKLDKNKHMLIMEREITVDFCDENRNIVFLDFFCEISLPLWVYNYRPIFKTLYVKRCRKGYTKEKRRGDLSTLIVTYVVCLGATLILSILIFILFTLSS